MKLVLLAALLGGLGVGLGCSHEAKPVVPPDEHPPLPPASPVGYLVDDASELKLSDDQLGKIREIDDALGAKLATYESELRNGEPVPGNNAPPAPRGLSVRGGASQVTQGGDMVGTPVGGAPMSGMPMAGGPLNNGNVNPGTISPPTETTKTYVVTGETVTRIHRARARDTREAIGRALALLDATQRVIARRVLTEHGVNPETGEVSEAAGAPGARPEDNPLTPIKQQPGEP
ncbi:MAG TPA: hypothetical protein VF516_46815 [Kofleriaceae bacterium]